MKKNQKWTLFSILGLSLFLLTACGLKLDSETLTENGGIYKVGDEIWKFKKDGDVQIYQKDGKPFAQKANYQYKIKDNDSSYQLSLIQDFKQEDKDYKISFSQVMKIKIPKEDQSIKSFTGTVKSVKVKDVQVESDIPEIKDGLTQNFSSDTLNKQLEDMVGHKIQFQKQDADYLKNKQKDNEQSK